jgi:hypothetical protein
MTKALFRAVLTICTFFIFSEAKSQDFYIQGDISAQNVIALNKFCVDYFYKTNAKSINIYYEGQLLFKMRRKSQDLEQQFQRARNQGNRQKYLSCIDIISLQSQVSAKYSHKRKVNLITNRAFCEDIGAIQINDFFKTGVPNKLKAKKDVLLFNFNRERPSFEFIHPREDNITDNATFVGKCNVKGQYFLHYIVNNKMHNVRLNSQEWTIPIELKAGNNLVSAFIVNDQGDTSNTIERRSITYKTFNSNSVRMLHPGGLANGNYTDVVIKCNHTNFNGFFNFKIALDKGISLDSVNIVLEDPKNQQVKKLKRLYNLDPSLKIVVDKGTHIESCIYLVFSEFGFESPCAIEDEFIYYLTYTTSAGNKHQTTKRKIYFESFRENYDEKPCNCF